MYPLSLTHSRFSPREAQRQPAKVKPWCILTLLSGLPPPTGTIQTDSQIELLPIFALLSMPTLSRSLHPALGLHIFHLLLERSSLLWRKKSEWLRLALTCPWILWARIRKGPLSFSAPRHLPARTATPLMALQSHYHPPLPGALPLTLFHQKMVQQGVKINLRQALSKPTSLLWKTLLAVVKKAKLWAVVRYLKEGRIRMFLTSVPNPQTPSWTHLGSWLTKGMANTSLILYPHHPLSLWNLTGLQHQPLVSPKLFQNLCSRCGPLLFGQVIKLTKAGWCSRKTLCLVQRRWAALPRGFIRQRRGRNLGQCFKNFQPLSKMCPNLPPICRCHAYCHALRNQGETLGTNHLYTLHLLPTEFDYLTLS